MNVVSSFSVIVEETGYESRQTASKLKILTKVLHFMFVAIFFLFFTLNECDVFIAWLCTADTPFPIFEGRGRLYTG